jgi:hypothetical protein
MLGFLTRAEASLEKSRFEEGKTPCGFLSASPFRRPYSGRRAQLHEFPQQEVEKLAKAH